ncbi:hypothetical protein D920_02947 [Enterococcus faecalis 13-SD-W-01]|jgi:hypothetical protein|nr:hypothetical protein D920_02947 [Enterococcus faecalis 13-SD-W-01]
MPYSIRFERTDFFSAEEKNGSLFAAPWFMSLFGKKSGLVSFRVLSLLFHIKKYLQKITVLFNAIM